HTRRLAGRNAHEALRRRRHSSDWQLDVRPGPEIATVRRLRYGVVALDELQSKRKSWARTAEAGGRRPAHRVPNGRRRYAERTEDPLARIEAEHDDRRAIGPLERRGFRQPAIRIDEVAPERRDRQCGEPWIDIENGDGAAFQRVGDCEFEVLALCDAARAALNVRHPQDHRDL